MTVGAIDNYKERFTCKRMEVPRMYTEKNKTINKTYVTIIKHAHATYGSLKGLQKTDRLSVKRH